MADPQRTCSFPGCERPKHSRGLCPGHTRQRDAGKPLTTLRPRARRSEANLAEFWTHVDIRADQVCWEWRGPVDADGYGDSRHRRAHVVAYCADGREVPDGCEIDHRCRNRRCVNPNHLQAVTHQKNHENRGVNANSTSGVRGVAWHAATRLWTASAMLEGKKYWAGRHATIEDAERAAIALRNKLFTNNLADQRR